MVPAAQAKAATKAPPEPARPQTGKVVSDNRDGIACWMIDTDYTGQSFFVRHAYFLGASDPYKSLKTTLKAIYMSGWQVAGDANTAMQMYPDQSLYPVDSAPKLIRRSHRGQGPGGGTARLWALILALFPAGIAVALMQELPPGPVLVTGLILFGIVFAINSAVHSYLILAYSDFEKVSMNVGFYYMANAGGRLAGTVLSGLVYQTQGLEGCLWWSAGFVLAAYILSLKLPEVSSATAKAASARV